MIVHVALFKWKDGTPEYSVKDAMDEVRSLKSVDKDIIDIRCGRNFSKWNEGFTRGVVVMAKRHTSIADKIDKMWEKSIGFDFED